MIADDSTPAHHIVRKGPVAVCVDLPVHSNPSMHRISRLGIRQTFSIENVGVLEVDGLV